MSEVPDSGIGHSQDIRTCRNSVGCCDQNTFQPTIPQPIRRKRRAGDRVVTGSDVGRDVRREGALWGTPRKRALFGLEGQDSVSSGSNVMEVRPGWPPEDEYLEEAQSPNVELADVVARLQKEVEEFRIRKCRKVGDSFSDLGLVWAYVNAGAHVCGEIQLGPILASV